MFSQRMPGWGAAIMVIAVASTIHAQNVNWESTVVQAQSRDRQKPPPVVSTVSLQPGGTLIAIAGDDHVVSLFDRGTGRFDRQLIDHTDWVRAVEFSPDGTQLATAGNDRRLMIWDVGGLSARQTLATHPAAIADIAWSHDGSMLAAVGFENQVRVYSADTGAETARFTASCADLRSVAFSPDDSMIAFGGRNGTVEIWNLRDGRRLNSLQLHEQRIRDLTLTAAGDLITCGDDQRVRITRVNEPSNRRTLPRHAGKLFCICPVRDDLLATAGSDNQIYIWRLTDLKQVGTLTGHTGTITSLDFEGNVLASGSFDTRIRIWTTEKTARQPDLNTFHR